MARTKRREIRIGLRADDGPWLRELQRRCRTGDLKAYGSVAAWAYIQLAVASGRTTTQSGPIAVSRGAFVQLTHAGMDPATLTIQE